MTLSLFGTFLSRFKLSKCAGQVFNVPGNVALGAVYLNPKTDKRSNSDSTEGFELFFDEATTASLNFVLTF